MNIEEVRDYALSMNEQVSEVLFADHADDGRRHGLATEGDSSLRHFRLSRA